MQEDQGESFICSFITGFIVADHSMLYFKDKMTREDIALKRESIESVISKDITHIIIKTENKKDYTVAILDKSDMRLFEFFANIETDQAAIVEKACKLFADWLQNGTEILALDQPENELYYP